MAKTDFRTTDEYIGTFPNDVQRILTQVRKAISDAVPGAEEVISYQIPAFRFHGWIFYVSAYKGHYSLSCPPPFTVFDVFSKELAPYERSKSTIRFPLDRPVPVALIGAMARFRAEENLRREGAKGAAPKAKKSAPSAKKAGPKAKKTAKTAVTKVKKTAVKAKTAPKGRAATPKGRKTGATVRKRS